MSLGNPARQGRLGVAEDRAAELQNRLEYDLEEADAGVGQVLDDDGRTIGVSVEVEVEPSEREEATSIARSADFDVLEVESIRTLDASRPGRVAYTPDAVRLTYGVFIGGDDR